MALFALREGYRVETTPSGGRVVHVRTGDTLELNFNEIQLLARAAAGGLEVADPHLKPIVKKLSGLGLLDRVSGADEATATGAPAAPEPAPAGAQVEEGLWVFAPPQGEESAPVGPETPTEVAELPKPEQKPPPDLNAEPKLDFAAPAEPPRPAEPLAAPTLVSPDLLVPVFRADLELKHKDKGGVFDVTDPKTGKTFAFYDFEISIARMLNGQRRFAEVVVAANALGIPVSVESLSQFVRQLARYGFLAPDGAKVEAPPAGSIWGKRAKWNNSIRTLFQSGMRLTRQGRYYEAAAYFEAILEHDPGNPEAVEMLQQVKDHLAKLPPDAPKPHPHHEPGELAATQDGLAPVDPELPASESSLESLEGTIAPDATATTTTGQPLPKPEAAPAFEASQAETEVSDISATLAAADRQTDWAELAAAPTPAPATAEAPAPDEQAPFDPFAEPAAVAPLGLNAHAAPEPPPKQTFDPFADSHAAAPDPFPAAPLKTRQPTVNPFARPVDRPVDLPRATPDPFAAIPPPNAAPPTATTVPDATPFDPFADQAVHDAEGHQPLESLHHAEPELPQFDAAALEGPPEPEVAPAAKTAAEDLPQISGIPAELKPVALPAAPEPAVIVDAAARTLSEAAPKPAGSLAEAVLEPIPDETLEVDGLEPAPGPASPPAPIPGAPVIEAAPEPAATLEATPAEAEKPAAGLPKPPFDPFAGAPALTEPTKPSDSPAPARPPSGPSKPPSGPAMPAPKLAPPPSSKARYLLGGVGLAAVVGGLVWFFALRTPEAPRPLPKPPVVAAAGRDAQAEVAVAGPDAAAALVAVASLDAGPVEAPAAGADAAETADTGFTGLDAATAGLDAAAAGLDAAAPGVDAAPAGPDAAAPAAAVATPTAGGDEGWTAVDVAKRGRVNMGDLKAPVAGTVTWGVTPNQERIKKGQVVGKIADADGNETALMSPNVGLLSAKAADGAVVQANELVASVPYFEAYGQTPFPGTVAPTPDWPCEVVDEAANQKAPCKVNKSEPRKGGFFVTFTTEPLWFDTAAKPKLRLKAP